jgi:hypothetical protein
MLSTAVNFREKNVSYGWIRMTTVLRTGTDLGGSGVAEPGWKIPTTTYLCGYNVLLSKRDNYP